MTDPTPRPEAPTPDRMARNGRQCAAQSKTTGGRCRQLAVNGATVCRWHGAAAPQVRAAARRRVAEAEVDRIATRFDLADAAPLTDPVGQLAKIAGQVVYVLDRLAESATGGPPAPDSPRFTALERALDRAARLLVDLNKLGLAEQQLALDAAQADLLGRIVAGIVADLGHDLEDPKTKAVVIGWLREGQRLEALGAGAA